MTINRTNKARRQEGTAPSCLFKFHTLLSLAFILRHLDDLCMVEKKNQKDVKQDQSFDFAQDKKDAEKKEVKKEVKELKEGVEAEELKVVTSIVVRHMDAAFARGDFIIDAKDPDGEEKLRIQLDKTYVKMFEELKTKMKTIKFGEGPEMLRNLKEYLRKRGYIYYDGFLTINDPKRRGRALRLMTTPTLHQIRGREEDRLDQYLKDTLEFSKDARVPVLYVSGNLITKGEELLRTKHGLTVRMLGTFEREPGGSAIIDQDAAKLEAGDRLRERGEAVEEGKLRAFTKDILHNTKVNEVFHSIYYNLMKAHVGTVNYERARIPIRGQKFTAGDLDEAFSNMGTLLYGKGLFRDRLVVEINNASSRTYEFTQLVFRQVAEQVTKDVGGRVDKSGISIPKDKAIEFETKCRKALTDEVFSLVLSLQKTLDGAAEKRK